MNRFDSLEGSNIFECEDMCMRGAAPHRVMHVDVHGTIWCADNELRP